ncbi:MAG: DUF2306 domain-containing protein [Devosia sp.]
MNLDPLLHASLVIQIHAFSAILAFVVCALVLFRRKGDATHRLWGKLWVAVMAIVALSSFFIWTIRLVGPFSPIHLLSLLTLVMLYRGVTYARRHQIKLHIRMMQATYIAALVIAGLFTFYPGRIMYKVAFGREGADPAKLAVFGFALLAVAAIAWLIMRWRRTDRRRKLLATP